MSIGNTVSEGIGIYGFNPQSEPPGQVAFEITTESSRGPGGRVAVYDTEDASTSLSGGVMEVGHKDLTYYPSGIFSVNSETCDLILTGEGAAGEPAVISMTARTDSAKVGIGTSNVTEALCVIGNIALTGNVVAYTETKLKSNIQPIDNALETIAALNGVSYDWRQNNDSHIRFSDRRQIGLLADDVEAVLPELVHYDADGNRLVAYTKLTAVLVEAVKELKADNDRLQKRVEQLERLVK